MLPRALPRARAARLLAAAFLLSSCAGRPGPTPARPPSVAPSLAAHPALVADPPAGPLNPEDALAPVPDPPPPEDAPSPPCAVSGGPPAPFGLNSLDPTTPG